MSGSPNRKLAVAIFLIALGVVASAYQGLLYATPPIFGALTFVSGLSVLFVTTAAVHRPSTLR